jgi:hypothetical protein
MTSSYYGVCINNFSPFTGTTAYTRWNIFGVNGGPLSFCGRYLNKNSAGVSILGAGTCAILKSGTWGDYNVPCSWDFTRATAPNMPILYANFTL